eukprot:11192543-Lingulodinium_polyedra.AAC.1
MMRLNLPSAVAARRKSHASRASCERHFGVCVERATRAICDALRPRTVGLSASLCTVFETVPTDAVESTGR